MHVHKVDTKLFMHNYGKCWAKCYGNKNSEPDNAMSQIYF